METWKTYRDLPPGPICTRYISEVNKTGGWRTFKPVIDETKCNRCYFCWKFCPDVAVDISEGVPKINYEFCKGCGICANECPKKAVRMVLEEIK